jgi:hypothetical protein
MAQQSTVSNVSRGHHGLPPRATLHAVGFCRAARAVDRARPKPGPLSFWGLEALVAVIRRRSPPCRFAHLFRRDIDPLAVISLDDGDDFRDRNVPMDRTSRSLTEDFHVLLEIVWPGSSLHSLCAGVAGRCQLCWWGTSVSAPGSRVCDIRGLMGGSFGRLRPTAFGARPSAVALAGSVAGRTGVMRDLAGCTHRHGHDHQVLDPCRPSERSMIGEHRCRLT